MYQSHFYSHSDILLFCTLSTVYIAPDAKANSALSLLHSVISTQLNKYPEAAHKIAGDSQLCGLKSNVPQNLRYVNCATCWKSQQAKDDTNIKQRYGAIPQGYTIMWAGRTTHLCLR